jgi:hypothetical protein
LVSLRVAGGAGCGANRNPVKGLTDAE